MIIHSLTLFCNDLDETKKFYTTILGFKIITEQQPVPDVKLALLERDGMKIELLERVGAPKVSFQDFTTTLGFQTENIDTDYEIMISRGIAIKSKLRNIGPHTRLFEITDPSGYPICIEQFSHP